ncbi:Aldehyde dehydrogenase [Hydrogenophaga intermedia]|uniref:Aldehyde dehydrogenase n=1 Tax=Hydrogenophaga intermedia TaxID=65786 RepID=A0A1L1PKE4_HYDIT|nr:Aldehyde dehydrogenase [Hydrogenophaga intermedia]
MTTTSLPSLSLDGRAFINGERIAARDGQTFDCFSPVDGRLLAPVARGQAATSTPP